MPEVVATSGTKTPKLWKTGLTPIYAANACSQTVVSAPAAGVVPAARPRSALARDARSVPHPRLRNHAAADAGRPRPAEVPRVARSVPDVRGARRRARSRRRQAPGIRSATTSGRAGCRPSRANRSRSYDGALPDDEETLRSFKGIGAYTAGAVMSFAFGKRAAILDTNVARVLFRVFVGTRRPRQSRDGETALGDLARRAAPPSRLRLQSGADGFRRDGLHRAQARSA